MLFKNTVALNAAFIKTTNSNLLLIKNSF